MSTGLSTRKDYSISTRGLIPGRAGVALVAENDDLMRKTLRYTLEEYGYQVIETNNGQECIQQYEQLHPDIVLLDCSMPIMDGYTCCKKLRMLDNAERSLWIPGIWSQTNILSATMP